MDLRMDRVNLTRSAHAPRSLSTSRASHRIVPESFLLRVRPPLTERMPLIHLIRTKGNIRMLRAYLARMRKSLELVPLPFGKAA